MPLAAKGPRTRAARRLLKPSPKPLLKKKKPLPYSASTKLAYGYPTPGPQKPTSQKVVDHTFFLSEHEWQLVREEHQFDYIIVGSGICGLAFAEAVLKENKFRRILILERGPFFLTDHFQNLPMPFQHVLAIGGISETFPWTLSAMTAAPPSPDHYIGWQHGMVPFFGGRSLLWSCWCPRPTPDEMQSWPSEVIDAASRHFQTAEDLLRVVNADEIDTDPAQLMYSSTIRPVYSNMQRGLQAFLQENLHKIPSATRCIPAPLAAASQKDKGIDFAKFAVPPHLLRLASNAADEAKEGKAAELMIKTDCIVEHIVQYDGLATALQTSVGVLPIGDAKLILAMGTLPPTTLLLNSFPGDLPKTTGERFTAHFVTSIIARVPRADFVFTANGIEYDFNNLLDFELAAIYMAGKAPSGMQYHVQLSVLSDRHPKKNAEKAARYMPDVVATASPQQLVVSTYYVVFVCAVLGELSSDNRLNNLRRNKDADPTTNVHLQFVENATDLATWDVMDEGTFEMLTVLSPKRGANAVEYWHGPPDSGEFTSEKPTKLERRVAGTVHEGSTLWIGQDDSDSPVGLDYRPRGVKNVYVTGGSLWPTSGSWNPTLTMVALTHDLADQLEKDRKERHSVP